jgi:hypothetical protein
MEAVLEPETMARPKGRPKTSERDDRPVRVSRSIVEMAYAIAKSRGVPVGEILDDILRVPIGKAYAKMLRDLEGTD